MKRHLYLVFAFYCLSFAFSHTARSQSLPWQDTSLSLDNRVEWLVQQLTLDEKLSLMVHHNPAIERLGLPAYSWWNEALHGVGRAGEATVYPMPIALAATFNPEVVHSVFKHVAAEARYKYREARDTGYYGDYSGLTFFTPNINIFRDPRWGRGMETYGEDPCLTALMGKACVDGLQNWDSAYWDAGYSLSTAACLKHFAVHSGPEGVRHEFNSVVSDRDLRTTYLPAFEYIIRNSEVVQVMCGYNRLTVRDQQGVNTQAGEPCCTNRRLFDILRNEWGYDGILVTDCWALNDAYETDTVIPRHRTHATAADAYGDAFGREVDLECGSGLPALREAVRQGLVSESKVDEHVRRILKVRLRITKEPRLINDSVYSNPDILQPYTQSMVLLKNNGILPLKANENLQLAGPNVWDSIMPLGNYNGTPRHTITIGEALSRYQLLSAGDAKTLVYVGGLNPQLEGEELPVEKEGFYKGDRTRIELPQEQVDEIKAYKAQRFRVVLVLCTGSAIALENVIDDCDAVLVGWYDGQYMGLAVHHLLYGWSDDFGRLPVTFYRSTDDLPEFSDYNMQGRTYRYADRAHVEFPFGYGLSYSYHQLWGAPTVDEANFIVEGMVSQCNTEAPNARNHRTVLQVYLKSGNDPDAPDKQLIAVQSITTVDFDHKVPFRIQLDPFWFRQYNPDTGLMEEPADGTPFTLQVGFSSDDKDLQDIPFTYHNRK